MTRPINIAKYTLTPGTTLDLRDSRGTTVTAVDGIVWITQAGDRADTLLESGQSFVVDRDGLVLVAAIGGPATAIIMPLQPARFDIVPPPASDRDFPRYY